MGCLDPRLLALMGALWLAVPALGESSPADAETGPGEALREAVAGQMAENEATVASQKRVEQLSDQTDELLTRYRGVLRQIESLRTYRSQMDEMILSQEEELSALHEQLDSIELVSRDVTPLMLKMIHALEKFVGLDVPFLVEERAERIADLRELMRRADVTESEKYRSIMEAYQIENEYGRTIEAYRSTLERDGKEITVDFLRIGRIALVYQTLDGAEAGAWSQSTRSWEPLDRGYRTAIRDGLRIARKQAAPDMIRIPLPAAEEAEGAL